jgi:hypothetical protein
MTTTIRVRTLCAVAPLLGAFTGGCSSTGGGGSGGLPENTGAIAARLTNVPADVQCIQIFTSDFHVSEVDTNVTPGTTATILIAPLSPGFVELNGRALNHPCNQFVFDGGFGGGGDASDDGGLTFGNGVTWEASPAFVNVIPGQVTSVDLHFHQPGGVNVNIDFDNCVPFSSFCGDGGFTEDNDVAFFDAAVTPD